MQRPNFLNLGSMWTRTATPEDYAFTTALGTNDVAALRALLARGVNPNREIAPGITMLHLSISTNNLPFAAVLLEHGANIETPSELPCQLLTCYDCQGSRNINRNCTNKSYMSPLHNAVNLGLLNMTKLLLDRGANIDALNYFNRTPLFTACIRRDMTFIRLLVEAGADLNVYDKCENCILTTAIGENNVELFDYLLDSGVDMYSSAFDLTPLHYAARLGRTEMVEKLINRGVPVDLRSMSGMTPLMNAVEGPYSSLHTIRLLLAKGADLSKLDCRHRTVACYAASHDNLKMLKLIHQIEPRILSIPDDENCTPLSISIFMQSEKPALFLAESGIDVNHRNSAGALPIIFASQRVTCPYDEMSPNAMIMRKLLENGAIFEFGPDPNTWIMTKRLNRLFTLVKSCGMGSDNSVLEQIAECIEQRVILNGRDAAGCTALHHAVKQNNPLVVSLLLRNRINVLYATVDTKKTALHFAMKTRREVIAKMLIQYANEYLSPNDENRFLNALTADGKTALRIAKEKRLERLVKVLEDNGAEDSVHQHATDMAVDSAPVEEARQPAQEAGCRFGCEQIADDNGKFCWTFDAEFYAIAMKLFPKYADVTRRDKLVHVIRRSPCTRADVELVDQLVELMLDNMSIKAKSRAHGNTLIHLVEDLGVISALLTRNAFYQEPNKYGQTPKQTNRSMIVERLFDDIDRAFENPDFRQYVVSRPAEGRRFAIEYARNRTGAWLTVNPQLPPHAPARLRNMGLPQAPAPTQAPVQSQPLALTQAPAPSQAPTQSQALALTQAPGPSQAPAQSQALALTQAPGPSQAPAQSQALALTQAPGPSQAPSPTEPQPTTSRSVN